MKKKLFFVLPIFMAFLALVSCGSSNIANDVINNEDFNESESEETKENNQEISIDVKGDYNKNILLLKNPMTADSFELQGIKYKSIKRLFKGSSWYEVTLDESIDAIDAYKIVKKSNLFEEVDLDYIVQQSDAPEQEVFASDPGYSSEWHLQNAKIVDMWKYMDKNSPKDANGKKITGAGGNKDTVIAVIDTGVDYNHPDLHDNMWVNVNEIPDNGIDDDGNGYVDDYLGWNAVAENGDPMDDQGHGTHCAGIVGAVNNKIGAIGVAYNCKIMAVKCGSAAGFRSSDIAEAVTYAYMNGADVISISIAGPDLSIAVKDAFEEAYHTTFIAAAAGNDGLKNEPASPGDLMYKSMYPACFPFVMGVMATTEYYGSNVYAGFSNWDTFHDNGVEYEIGAPGVGIFSTFPNNRYATWSGTSMATPIVAGVAALLRSYYPDKEVYTNKFLMSQIAENAGTLGGEKYPGSLNAYDALTKTPKPSVSLYDYYVFEREEYSSKNNGDGIVDAGETIHLAISLKNKGGLASNIECSLINKNVSGNADPYVEIIDGTMSLDNIGTYSIREPEKVKDSSGKVVDTVQYFTIKISDNAVNNYQLPLRLLVTYKNGLDEKDNILYQMNSDSNDGYEIISISLHKGTRLPRRISEDTVFSNEYQYILADNLVIDEGVTCTFEAGCKIQVYESENGYYDEIANSIKIINYGTLIFDGTKEDRIKIYPCEDFEFEQIAYFIDDIGNTYFKYCDITNLRSKGSAITLIDNCNLITDRCDCEIVNGRLDVDDFNYRIIATKIINSSFVGDDLSRILDINVEEFIGNTFALLKSKPGNYPYPNLFTLNIYSKCENNVFIQQKEFDLNDNSNGDYDPLTIYLWGGVNSFNNNVFINSYDENTIPLGKCTRIIVQDGACSDWYGNTFDGLYGIFRNKVVYDYNNGYSQTSVEYFDDLKDETIQAPYVKSIEIYDSENELTDKIERGLYTYKVKFNCPMDTSQELNVYFGSRRPFNDFKIVGDWEDEYTWVGTYSLKSLIEDGNVYFRVKNGYKADSLQELVDEGSRISATINILSAYSMNLSGNATEDGIQLNWIQDDYEVLMGYNIYRSDSKDGNYVKLNYEIIPSDINEFTDENAEPGKNYWYTFTVVLTDLSESIPAAKINVTAIDTEKPNLYHTPINQGYLNNKLVITCTASDNVIISNVILYYRTTGSNEYKSIVMSKANDKYSATISALELSLEGLEYYIVASDGVNTINKGTKESPYNVVIKDSSLIAKYGDVDGDGIITTKDALMIIKAINGDLILTDDQFKRADLNKDNTLSSVEALRILQYINGNVITLEM